ncbi:hypothetical protein BG015_002419 [Linnemannia schmuckeri]|uniref:DNA primase large subunit n=1 Tax=Linnemannia schmuckeri TaxID=64567 RepID=A0A9P5VD50_9FUNG|nr:hypothetical protein BG015_002419 [Linnemannia schmuckeri]
MFTQHNRKNRQLLASGIKSTYEDDLYPTRLNFYREPPPLEISIEEFEQFALDRMQVLQALLTAQMRNLTPEQLDKAVSEAIRKYMPMSPNSKSSTSHRQLMEERRKDHISHFILRLAYSRSQELRSWFLRAECALFRYRFEKEMLKDQLEFLEKQNLSWKKVSDEDKRLLKEKLKSSSFKPGNIDEETYFEVDFERVTGLVGRRQVYIQAGKAFVRLSDQVVLVLDEFKERLSHALEVTGRALPRMDEDDRLMPVLNNINKQYLGREFTSSAIAGEIQASDVDSVRVHMPLCMEHLHDELRREKHTRHGGRMQYGLFLKGIGLSLEQALLFWQMAFEKLTPEQFNKNYAYNVRHSYGMEGKRTDYTPYSCKSIIMNNAPGPGDHHGCPFRHFSIPNLRAQLAAHHVDEFDTDDIIHKVQQRHYQIACTRYYEVTRAKMVGISPENVKGGLSDSATGSLIASQEVIEHPNQFFEQSYLLMKNKNAEYEGGAASSSAAGAGGMGMDGVTGSAPLDATVKGRYTYKKANASISSNVQHDIDM